MCQKSVHDLYKFYLHIYIYGTKSIKSTLTTYIFTFAQQFLWVALFLWHRSVFINQGQVSSGSNQGQTLRTGTVIIFGCKRPGGRGGDISAWRHLVFRHVE